MKSVLRREIKTRRRETGRTKEKGEKTRRVYSPNKGSEMKKLRKVIVAFNEPPWVSIHGDVGEEVRPYDLRAKRKERGQNWVRLSSGPLSELRLRGERSTDLSEGFRSKMYRRAASWIAELEDGVQKFDWELRLS